ncbi:MAG: type II toxin-antitoxin system HicA family toxin [Planctomycetota bacterium]
MSSKHEKTRQRVFAQPTPANIRWSDIEAMLRHFGAEVTEGSGSRVRVDLNGVLATFHRPHPQKEANRGTVRDVADLLRNAGATGGKQGDDDSDEKGTE